VITVASPLLMLKFVDVRGKDLTPEFQEKVKKSKEEVVADANCKNETVIRGAIGTIEAEVRKVKTLGRYLIYAGDHLPKGK
jgi:hypothetical protein